tara:strand:- start:7601 stop:8185 length:585 start_codon:yes stop_codon:yes gene_type:complete
MASEYVRTSGKIKGLLSKSGSRFSIDNISIESPSSLKKGDELSGTVQFFSYPVPKTIDTIPYYHLFPGVLVIDVNRDYLTGMNLFHLPRKFRSFFLKKVLTSKSDEGGKIDFSYNEMLSEKYLSAVAKSCVRRYIIPRMGAVSLQLHPDIWEDFFLGSTSRILERTWRKKSASTAYKKSYEEILKNILDTFEKT